MRKNRHILLTFDHELFLGQRSGDMDSCMIRPSRLLQEIFSEFGIKKTIFFLDTTYLACLRRNADTDWCQRDYGTSKANVKFLLEAGHYVFPHIHPHWLDAEMSEENWVHSNLSKYVFKNCSGEEKAQVWKDSFEILKDFGVDQYHEINGFRAGGWCLQPFTDFAPFFKQYGITHDFTVLPYSYLWTNAQQYDYTGAKSPLPYRFEEDVMVPVQDGSFVEIPISIRARTPDTFREKIFRKYLWKTGNRSIGQGKGVVPEEMNYTPKADPKAVQMISIELLHALNFSYYEKFLKQNELMHFISHPKMLSLHNLKYFRKLMTYASQNYNLDFDYKSILIS